MASKSGNAKKKKKKKKKKKPWPRWDSPLRGDDWGKSLDLYNQLLVPLQ